MGYIPDFRNLYPKSLIPMGARDRENYCRTLKASPEDNSITKWVTAFAWEEGSEVSGWKVYVFPASANGAYVGLGLDPYFISQPPATFQRAKEIMNFVESSIASDSITANKISIVS